MICFEIRATALHPRLRRNEGFLLELDSARSFSICSHKNEPDPQILSLGAATSYNRRTPSSYWGLNLYNTFQYNERSNLF